MESISNLIFSLFRGTPQHADWVTACLQGAWERIVGPGIARACRPAALSGTELLVSVQDATWEATLRSLRDQMLEKVRLATGGEVQSLRLCKREVNPPDAGEALPKEM
jgi:predicted nucleic acid-binding Zn ribbon protein